MEFEGDVEWESNNSGSGWEWEREEEGKEERCDTIPTILAGALFSAFDANSILQPTFFPRPIMPLSTQKLLRWGSESFSLLWSGKGYRSNIIPYWKREREQTNNIR
ncbi:unnamed protein product [Musa acuminata subsp. burmannicoides]